MSVAFRRDGDEEHLEPHYELPIPAGPNLVTPRGLALIHDRVAGIEAALPGLTDEAEIKAARRHLRYWRTRQATAQIAPTPDGQAVAIGCSVAYRLHGQDRQITIVGHDEAEPAQGLLAFTAPLARTMIGAEVGEMLDFGGKSEALEILAITLGDR